MRGILIPKRKRIFGFTVIELLVTCTIIAILLAIGLAYWKSYQRKKTFNTAFDNFVGMLETAQNEAKAYGKDPTGFKETGSMKNNVFRNEQYMRLCRRGFGKTDKIENYKNLVVLISAANGPMTQDTINTEFNGVALCYGEKTGDGPDDYSYDWTLLFAPNGLLYWPGTVPGVEEIQIDLKDDKTNPSMWKQIFIHQLTGNIRTVQVK